MLQHLSIRNYALIQSAQLEFDKGFTVITGETGAGKSILLGALGLITGKRADTESAGDPTQKCVIEGTFAIENYKLKRFFKECDLDFEEHTIIRRELLPSGKSRAFINDTPVTLAQLQQLGTRLIDIHSQHKTMDVVEHAYQFEMLDTFANNGKQLESYVKVYNNWRGRKQLLKDLIEKKKQAQLEYDYQSFLFKELDEAVLEAGEYERVEEELNTLSHADEIMQQLAIAVHKTSLEDIGAIDTLSEARAALSRINKYGAQYQELHDRIQSTLIELEDAASTLGELAKHIEADPLQLERLNNRMQLLHNLTQKHHVGTVEELISIRDRIDVELQDIQGVDDQILTIEKEIALFESQAFEIAGKLYKDRRTAIPQLKSLIEKILVELGMPNAHFDVSLVSDRLLQHNGIDRLEFLFSANKGAEPKPLGKGASGGELSRVMLALKSVLSSHKRLPTLIFDEIDTGVSGDVALKMGAILKKMGHTMQLISITHLPQIAGQGTSHFKVYKRDTDERTQTYIDRLKDEERLVEITAMLGGNRDNGAAMEHAKNLLN